MSEDRKAEERTETPQDPQELSDEELKKMSGGTGGSGSFDHWHTLPDGSGSGHGE